MLIRFAAWRVRQKIRELSSRRLITSKTHSLSPIRLRSEAEEYLLQYLDNFAYPKIHDHLTAIFNTIAWLKPKNDTMRMRIQRIHDLALSEWGDGPLADSADIALIALGAKREKTCA